MHEWAAAVPVVGGTTLIVGSGLTIYVDRLERLNDASTPRPVMYRFFSQAILAMHQWPHWIFLVTCTIFGPCLFLTAVWQAKLLEMQCRDEDCISLAWTLKMDGLLCAVSVFLDAWIPLGRPVITHISHTLVAIGFFVFGAHYVYNTITMASILKQHMVMNLRRAFMSIMVLAGGFILMTTSPAVNAHGRILDHQFRGTKESRMEQEEIIKCRRLEACMSTAQMVLGIGLGFTQCTAVLDVVKLMDNISGDETTTVATAAEEWWAILMFTIKLCMTIIQYLYRDKIYQWCQSMLLRFRMSSQNTIAKAD